MLATIVDLTALWKILIAVFAVGVGVTAVFGEGALAVTRIAQARRDGRSEDLILNGLLVVLAAVVCAAALVIGFLAMTHK
jgi:Na+/proline symporter